MGLDDLIDDDDEDDESNNSSEQTTGEEEYFSNGQTSRSGVIDEIKEEIEVDGAVKPDHTKYVAITPMLKVEGGVALRKDKTKIVDLNGKEQFTITYKELKVKYGDRTQIKSCYEIRVR